MKLRGCYVAIVTPFKADGTVDENGLRDNIEFLLEHGVAGIVPCGTTGESATLSWEEHFRVVGCAISQVRGRAQVIAGAGSNNTQESIEAAIHAREKGADAILCITPYYNRPTQEGLYEHFRTIAEAVDIPMVVYNVPTRTGVNLAPTTLERLCAFRNIVGVKEASGNLVQISEIHRLCGDRMSILSGDDALTLPILAVGGEGVISVAANIIPDRVSAMIETYLRGDTATAMRLHEDLLPLFQALFIETNPIPLKTAMRHLGFAAGPLRLPLVEMAPDNKEKLFSVLQQSSVRPRR